MWKEIEKSEFYGGAKMELCGLGRMLNGLEYFEYRTPHGEHRELQGDLRREQAVGGEWKYFRFEPSE